MSTKIRTINTGNAKLVNIIKDTFGLNDEPFSDIDDDLLLLAFIPEYSNVSKSIKSRLRKKYDTDSNETLEFFGDRILYGIIANILYDMFGLGNNPKFLTQATIYLTNNRLLTDIMLDKKACGFVRSNDYVINDRGSRFHNMCADSLEALIGALYVHLTEKRLDQTHYITQWLLKNTNITFYLREYLDTIGRYTVQVYNSNDKEALLQENMRNNEQVLATLESLKDDLDYDVYQGLYDIVSSDIPNIDDFAETSIVVRSNTPLQSIYQQLGWTYENPEYDSLLEVYYIYGYPRGIRKPIANGTTPEEAIENAYTYLKNMGYIYVTKEVQRYFR